MTSLRSLNVLLSVACFVAAAAAAVVFAFLLVVLPGPTRTPGALGVAGAVGVLVVVLAASWRCSPVLARVGTPAAFSPPVV